MMERNCQEKFIVLDKMAAVAQAGHKIQSNPCVVHVSWHPGENNLHVLRALAVCSCSVLLQQGNTNIIL